MGRTSSPPGQPSDRGDGLSPSTTATGSGDAAAGEGDPAPEAGATSESDDGPTDDEEAVEVAPEATPSTGDAGEAPAGEPVAGAAVVGPSATAIDVLVVVLALTVLALVGFGSVIMRRVSDGRLVGASSGLDAFGVAGPGPRWSGSSTSIVVGNAPSGAPRLSGGLAATVTRVAQQMNVAPEVLCGAAANVQARALATDDTDRRTASKIRSETRMGARFLPILPLTAAAVAFVGGARPVGLFGWSLLVLAGMLTVVGANRVGRLPEANIKWLREQEHALNESLQWADQVAETLDTAELYAAAGAEGIEALEAAAPDYVAHPVRLAIESAGAVAPAPVGLDARALGTLVDDVSRASGPELAEEILRRGSDALWAHYRADLRRRVHLVRLGMVAALVCCFVPATLSSVLAFAS